MTFQFIKKGLLSVQEFFCRKFLLVLLIMCGFNDSALGWNISEDYDTVFMRLRQMERISVAFASQNLNDPALAFGHTLFVFHNDVIPESDSIAFEYIGDSQSSLFMIKSLFWTIPGIFRLRSWDQEVQGYDKDDIEVWVIPLKLEDHEREKLIQQVIHSLFQPKPYNFFFYNCASYIFEMLKNSVDDMPCSVKFYVSPVEMLQSLYRCQKTGQPIYFPTRAASLAQSVKSLSSKEKAVFEQLVLQNPKKTFANLKTASENMSLPLKTAMTEWIEYKILQADLKEEKEDLLELKETYHYQLEMEQKDFTEIHTPRNGRVTLQYQKGWNQMGLAISPAQIRFLSSIDNRFWADHFEVATLGFTFSTQYFFLSQFNLLDISTNTSEDIMKIPFAKDLYLGYQKYSLGLGSTWEHWLARLGAGLTYSFTDHWKVSLLSFLQVGVVQDLAERHFALGTGLAGRMFMRFSSWLRIKLEIRQLMLGHQNFFINSIGNAQFIFYDRKPFVASAEYSAFYVRKDLKWYNSLGVSLSYLF